MPNLIAATANDFNTQPLPTMSSREIAQLCGKRHDNVMRDIKNILLELYDEKDILKFEGIFSDSMNRKKTEYLLPKRECLILVSGYSTTLRAKIIDRWQELEKQATPPQIDYSSPKAMIGFLNYLQGQIDQKDTIIEDLTPKAMALESLQRTDGLFGLTEAAKILEMQPKQFIIFLQKKGWVYRRTFGAHLLPYQDKIQKGLMDCSTHTVQTENGTEKVIPSAKITTKGMGVLSQEIKRQNMH
ncbi:Rha family transcriptional regulator [Bartonella sp. AU18XJBT]|uniref:Rha family transcriptional regulator n=1 Tax=Bartonella sp. AU18XJBT TaxID=3019089 RepID=UPI00235EF737|nr:phage regulatory protein/antirepressor Ant [Bartonella sp. AU18XJBT]